VVIGIVVAVACIAAADHTRSSRRARNALSTGGLCRGSDLIEARNATSRNPKNYSAFAARGCGRVARSVPVLRNDLPIYRGTLMRRPNALLLISSPFEGRETGAQVNLNKQTHLPFWHARLVESMEVRIRVSDSDEYSQCNCRCVWRALWVRREGFGWGLFCGTDFCAREARHFAQSQHDWQTPTSSRSR